MATILVEILGNARQFKAELAGAEAATARAGGSFAGFGKVAGAAGVLLAGGVAFGMAKAISAAGDFEQKLNVLRAVTAGTNKEMAQASKLAIALGADAKLPAVSAGDAADAMLQLGKAGFTMQQSMAAARGTLLLATAAQIDSGLSAKTVTQAVNAFGLEAKDTSVIVDQMAGFMNTTGTSFEAFADSLSYVASPAHAVGQTFKETAAQLAILSKAGQEGSMAGTGLRKMLNELVAGKARGFFHDLGVETVNANDKFIGMHALIQKLHPILEKMTAPERLGLMKQAFGLTAMNQANILLGIGVDKYDAATAAIGRKGQADQLAASHMQGYKGAMAQLGSALETLEIEIGLKLLPIATRFALWLTTELPVAVAMTQRAIAFLTPYFIQVKTAVEQVVAAVRTHWTQIAAVIKAVVDDIKAQLNLFGDLIHGRWDKIWDDVVQVVKAKVALLVSAAKLIGPLLLAAMEEVGRLAAKGLVAGLRALPGALEAGMKALPGLAMAAAQLVGEAIVKGIKWAVPHIAGLAGDLIGKIGDALGQVASWAFTSARQIGFAIADGVLSGIGNLGTRLKDAVTGAARSALGGVKGALGISSPSRVFEVEIGMPIGEGIISGFLLGSASLPDKMNATLRAALNTAKNVVTSRQAVLSAAFSQLGEDVGKAFDARTSAHLNAIGAKFDALRAKVARAGAALTPSEKALADLQSGHDSAGRAQAITDAQAGLATAQAGGDPAEILRAQQALDDSLYNQQVATLQAAATQERVAADAETARKQAVFDTQQAKAQLDYQAERDLQKRHLDTKLAELSTQLEKNPATFAKHHSTLMKWLENVAGPDMKESGKNLGVSFAKGLAESIKEVNAAGHSLALELQKFLKLSSPAEKGPLSDLDSWWKPLGATLLSGVDTKMISGVTSGMSAPALSTPSAYAASSAPSAGGAGGGVTVIVNGWVGNDQDIAEKIRNTLIRTGRRTTGGALGGFA